MGTIFKPILPSLWHKSTKCLQCKIKFRITHKNVSLFSSLRMRKLR